MQRFFPYVLSFFLSACSTMPRHSGGEASLSRPEADQREKLVSNVRYNLEFVLSEGKTFSGLAKIHFDIQGTPQHTFLDFAEGTIKQLKVNGDIVGIDQDKVRVYILKGWLKSGANLVEVEFEQNFSNDGDGLLRFEDPEDKRVYLYSNLEPFGANRIFPCFDQPDLKATYAMQVRAPKDWSVITYAAPTSVVSGEAGQKLWSFPESASFSTYIWSLHAGPYKKWTAKNARIPMALYARQSLAKYVLPEFWFKNTQQGFDFYEKYFATPYPYTKYDQILVPDFPSGAMENVGAVTFSERFVKKGKRSRANMRDHSNTILHELAHMWFGNLVTMKWWNDLWLNESFATFMATLAQEKNTEYSGAEAWRDFYGTKSWAYGEDDAVTTHAIEAPVETTLDAFTNFDGITYGKGASLLKQLNFYLDSVPFRNGIQNYFKTHAGKNTVLSDFIRSLELGSEKDLSNWVKQWLQSSGVNRIEFQQNCENGNLQSYTLLQRAPLDGDKLLRDQKTLLAPYYLNGETLLKGPTTLASVSGENTTLSAASQTACPMFVDSNSEDHAYFLPVFSAEQAQFFLQNFKSFSGDPFLRQRVWADLYFMFREGQLPLKDYADALAEAISYEEDPLVLGSIVQSLVGFRDSSESLYRLWPKLDKKGMASFLAFAEKLEKKTWLALKRAPISSETQKELFRAFYRFVITESGAKKIEALLDGQEKIAGVSLDQDKRWQLLLALARSQSRDVLERVSKELKLDPSSQGQQEAISVRAAFGEVAFVAEWQQRILSEENLNHAELRAFTSYLFTARQEQERSEFAHTFLSRLRGFLDDKNSSFLNRFLVMAPSGCLEANRNMMLEFLENNKVSPIVEKALRKRVQLGERCQKVQRATEAQN